MLNPDALFAPLPKASRLLLAVSGGPDSMALMHLALRWRSHPQLSVATVDHGFRVESRAEAEQVAHWAATAGLPHHLLVWQGEKPRTAIQERARAARYDCLADCAERIGAQAIVTGHHADDQAETILMRLVNGSGTAGLAGMRLRSDRDGPPLWRPLLDVPKAALVAYCQSIGQPFFTDPSNANEASGRVKLRKLAGLLEELGLDRDSLLRLGRRAARADDALEHAAAALRKSLRASRDDGSVSIDMAGMANQPDEIAIRILGGEVLHVASGSKRLRLERIESLWSGMKAALQAEKAYASTLGGATLRMAADGILIIRPEPERKRGRRFPGIADLPVHRR